MKSKNLIIISVLFLSQFICAQINVLNADDPSEIGVLSEEQKKTIKREQIYCISAC